MRSHLHSLVFAACVGSALSGCRSTAHHDDCLRPCDIPHGAVPAPVGTYVGQHQDLQIARGIDSSFVIHENEWYRGGFTLGPAGERRLTAMVPRLHESPQPVIIEPYTPDFNQHPSAEVAWQLAHAIDADRRALIVQRLESAGIVDAEQRVVINYPQAEGLSGNEAPRLFWQQIRGGARGGMGGGMGGMGGGMGGMGGGMGGMGGGMGGMGGGFF